MGSKKLRRDPLLTRTLDPTILDCISTITRAKETITRVVDKKIHDSSEMEASLPSEPIAKPAYQTSSEIEGI